MTTLSKKLMCVQMRTGVEIWIEHEKAQALQDILENITGSRFVFFEGQTFNTADLVGVFNADTMADATRRKNGMWQCQQSEWHDRKEVCGCIDRVEKQKIEERMAVINACGKCQNGFLLDGETARPCNCLEAIEYR